MVLEAEDFSAQLIAGKRFHEASIALRPVYGSCFRVQQDINHHAHVFEVVLDGAAFSCYTLVEAVDHDLNEHVVDAGCPIFWTNLQPQLT